MKTYRTKPVEARQLTDGDRKFIEAWMGKLIPDGVVNGDWIVKWPNGEFFAVKEAMFSIVFVEEKG